MSNDSPETKPVVANPQLTSALRRVLEQECQLQQQYMKLLSQGEQAVSQLDTERLQQVDRQREDVIAQMNLAAEQRFKLIEGYPQRKLTELIEVHFTPAERDLLMPLATQLRGLALETKQASDNFNQILHFGSRMVSGTISILNSVSQNVTKGYSRRGREVETARNVKPGLTDA
jgi:hypothetical protein